MFFDAFYHLFNHCYSFFMKNKIKFRVLLDSKESQDVFRDVEVLSDATFESLHTSILDAFEFQNGEMASFYLSNDEWTREEEITLMDMGVNSEREVWVMSDTTIGTHINKEKQKLIYIYDFFRMWTFLIEVQEISEPDSGVDYPHISLSYGEAPDQESKMPEDTFGSEPFNLN